jgi:hypothetical protein
LGIILWIPALFNTPFNFPIAEPGQNTQLFEWMISYVKPYPKASAAIALACIVAQSLILIRLNFKHIFIENKTYLPSVIFVIIGSSIVAMQQLHPALVSNFFLLWALDKALVIDKGQNAIKRYFESGLFLGLGTLIYPNMYVFIPTIWLTLIILQNSRWRDWTASIIGFLTPILIYFALLFFNGKHATGFNNFYQLIFNSSANISFSTFSFIPIIVLGVLFIISLLAGLRYIGIKKINTRKYYTFFFWFLLLNTAISYFLPTIGLESIYMAAIPISIIFAIFYTESRSKWFKEFFFTLTILSAIALIWLH